MTKKINKKTGRYTREYSRKHFCSICLGFQKSLTKGLCPKCILLNDSLEKAGIPSVHEILEMYDKIDKSEREKCLAAGNEDPWKNDDVDFHNKVG